MAGSPEVWRQKFEAIVADFVVLAIRNGVQEGFEGLMEYFSEEQIARRRKDCISG